MNLIVSLARSQGQQTPSRQYGTYAEPYRNANNADTAPRSTKSTKQLESTHSNAWEKAELKGKGMSWDEIAQRSGFNSVRRLRD